MKAKNKILLKIEQKEEKRKEKIENKWWTLIPEDKLYMENVELFNL